MTADGALDDEIRERLAEIIQAAHQMDRAARAGTRASGSDHAGDPRSVAIRSRCVHLEESGF
jgi:hypothetical protein